MDAALEKLRNEYRRCKAVNPLNLSGKRTEIKSKGAYSLLLTYIVLFSSERLQDSYSDFFIERKSSYVGIT